MVASTSADEVSLSSSSSSSCSRGETQGRRKDAIVKNIKTGQNCNNTVESGAPHRQAWVPSWRFCEARAAKAERKANPNPRPDLERQGARFFAFLFFFSSSEKTLSGLFVCLDDDDAASCTPLPAPAFPPRSPCGGAGPTAAIMAARGRGCLAYAPSTSPPLWNRRGHWCHLFCGLGNNRIRIIMCQA